MYCRAHKTATLTPIQHTVLLGATKLLADIGISMCAIGGIAAVINNLTEKKVKKPTSKTKLIYGGLFMFVLSSSRAKRVL